MVCKECGAYNAENMSVCKECGAKLREDDTSAGSVDTLATHEEGRPARDFVKPPAWPKSAYAGAPEKTVTSTSSELPTASGAFRPTIPPRVAASATQTCPHCGKPALSDAPFCAYCGQRLTGEVAAAPVSARPAQKAAPAPVQQRSAFAANDFDDEDEDEYDEDDEEDYKPAKGAKRPAKLVRRESEELDEFDEEDEEEYDEDYDDMPKKRGKGTTILFWGLIGLLLALIAVFGMYIAKKNFNGDFGAMFASIGNIFNKGSSDDVNAADPAATTDPESQMYTATIMESTDQTTNEVWYDIDIIAPTGSTIRVITDATLTTDTVKVAANNLVRIHIPRDVFMPNAPVDTETLTLQPNIQAISTEGETMQISVPPITVVVPTLSMTVTEPASDTVNATYDNKPIAIIGQVNNYDADMAVFINDVRATVDSTGLFTASYTPTAVAAVAAPTSTPAASTDPSVTPDPSASPDASTSPETTAEETAATEEPVTEEATSEETAVSTGTAETITIEVRKNNYVTARKVITIEPYVVQTMSFTVTNELTSLSSDTGAVTITGTCTPGAKITATSTSADVTFGEATVTETGTFSILATIAKVGGFDVTLVGKLEGYYDGTANVIVERPPTASSSAFKKAAGDLSKNYEKIKSGATTSGDFVVTGRITEIISTDPYTIFRVQISEGVEVIIYNRSAKSTINSSDLKEKKQVAGTPKGFYTDGVTPVLWGWFIWNK